MSPLLRESCTSFRGRVINDLSVLASSDSQHSRVISERFGSSYTCPLVDGDRLRGFVFFDATEVGYFQLSAVARLSPYVELMSVILTRNMVPAKILTSAVEVAAEISHSRDPETGAHLDRMSLGRHPKPASHDHLKTGQ